ncbi:MAG TPA: PilZ domain-containing protein [Bryobacteraceae bacterium]|nr:PilZ domain-containing protein [Bryobacteraceae bacterium]
MIEQRKTKRFELKLPLEVVRKSFQPVSSAGMTKNLSAGGVLFAASIDVEIGDPIEYVITFPTHSINGGSVNLRCLGKVVRVETPTHSEESGEAVVAATLERYEFVRD